MLKNSLRLMISLSVLIFILGSASPNFSQEKTTEPINLITLKVTAPNGTWAIASVFEGEMLTMVDEKTESGFGFVPIVRNAKDRAVEVKVLQITKAEPNSKPVENLYISIGSPKTTGSSFKVEVQAIARHLPNERENAALFKTVAYATSSAVLRELRRF